SRIVSANVVVLPHWTKRYPRSAVVRNYPVLEKNNPTKEKNLFTYVGVLGSKRSAVEMTTIAVELMKQLPGAKFNIIGNFFDKGIKSKVLEQVNQTPGITYQGFQPFPEVKKNLARSEYGFVLYADLRYIENIPVKMYEYLANGVIPIFSSFDEFKYDVEEEGWGIGVNPRKPQEAAKKILENITDETKRNTLEENLKRYRTKYSWESEEKELLDLYKGLANKYSDKTLNSGKK
ncbi:MAG: glycosyltransferase family 4 protein, partial [bacterium]|nr:glycosyltransferase family 4 protein [bacterium]